MTLDGVTTGGPTESGGLAAALGLSGADTAWVSIRATVTLQQWIQGRWTVETSSFKWETTDQLFKSYQPGGFQYFGDSSVTVEVAGLPDRLVAAVLLHTAFDNHDQVKAQPSFVRSIVDGLRDGGCADLAELPEDGLNAEAAKCLRRWLVREDIATADPDMEWRRTVIRTAVIQGSDKNLNLPVGSVSQPWLRDMLVNVLRARYPSTKAQTIQGWVRSCIRLSRFLELPTSDSSSRGQTIRNMSATTMDDYAAMLRRDAATRRRYHRQYAPGDAAGPVVGVQPGPQPRLRRPP